MENTEARQQTLNLLAYCKNVRLNKSISADLKSAVIRSLIKILRK